MPFAMSICDAFLHQDKDSTMIVVGFLLSFLPLSLWLLCYLCMLWQLFVRAPSSSTTACTLFVLRQFPTLACQQPFVVTRILFFSWCRRFIVRIPRGPNVLLPVLHFLFPSSTVKVIREFQPDSLLFRSRSYSSNPPFLLSPSWSPPYVHRIIRSDFYLVRLVSYFVSVPPVPAPFPRPA